MIKETVQVQALFADFIHVTALSSRVCSSCKSRPGCGQHLFDKLLGYRAILSIDTSQEINLDLGEGDWVEVGIPENALLFLSMLGYLLPVVLMLLAVAGLQVWVDSELALASCALLTLFVVGIFTSRFMKTPYATGALKAVYIKKVHSHSPTDQVLSLPLS